MPLRDLRVKYVIPVRFGFDNSHLKPKGEVCCIAGNEFQHLVASSIMYVSTLGNAPPEIAFSNEYLVAQMRF